MGCEPVLLSWPPLRLARIVLRARIGLCRCPAASPVRFVNRWLREVMVVSQVQPLARWLGRAVGLDLHRDFCVIAICEEGLTISAGRVPMTAGGVRVAGGFASAERPGGDGGVRGRRGRSPGGSSGM